MKKWAFLLVLLLLLGGEVIFQLKGYIGDGFTLVDNKAQDGSSLKGAIPIQVTGEQIYKGNLVLVNKENPVHQSGVQSDVVTLAEHDELIAGYGLLDNTIQLSENVAQEFITMIDAAQQEGVNQFLISSGYRDVAEQERLFQEMGAEFALPAGHSEHNLGLSLDIGSFGGLMSQAPEGKWLQRNAWMYGFVLRYPEDKTAITGIEYEPWHFRYVGLPHSVIMLEKNFTLEEYLEYLKEKKFISTTVQGEKYEIAYYPVNKHTTIYVPVNRDYEMSGDNMSGVIITVHL